MYSIRIDMLTLQKTLQEKHKTSYFRTDDSRLVTIK